jgi:hypothetical protein
MGRYFAATRLKTSLAPAARLTVPMTRGLTAKKPIRKHGDVDETERLCRNQCLCAIGDTNLLEDRDEATLDGRLPLAERDSDFLVRRTLADQLRNLEVLLGDSETIRSPGILRICREHAGAPAVAGFFVAYAQRTYFDGWVVSPATRKIAGIATRVVDDGHVDLNVYGDEPRRLKVPLRSRRRLGDHRALYVRSETRPMILSSDQLDWPENSSLAPQV